MKKILILCIAFLLIKTCYSQTCSTDTVGSCFVKRLLNNTDCENFTNYSPENASQTPIITVRLSFHIFLSDDSTGNFQNNVIDKLYLNNIIKYCNICFSNLGTLNIGNSIYIADSRIRFKLENIYFHPHTSDMNFTDGDYVFNKYITNDFDNLGLTIGEKDSTQHILIGNPSTCVGGRASSIGGKGWINETGWFNYRLNHGESDFLWPSDNLIHEMGHSMGLLHNFQGGTSGRQCDACSDNDMTSGDCPVQASSTNYMDYFPSGWASSNPGFSKCQLSTVHFLLSGRSNISDIVLKDYCSFNSLNTINVNNSSIWINEKNINGNLIIENGVTLTIKCNISFSNESILIVQPGGKLILDGGILTNSCDGLWKGIEVWGTANKSQISPDAVFQGKLDIINGGIIENAEVAVYVGKRDAQGMHIVGTEGGLVKGTSAVFKNNKIAVVMKPYHNFLPSSPTTQKPNFSFFTYCTFETNSSWNFPNTYPDAFVKLYQVEGICFDGCTFTNSAPANFAVYNRGKGIVSEDASFILNQYCASLITPCTNLISTSFTNLYYAVDAKKISINNSLSIIKSVFNSNYRGVYISGVLTPKITNNTFSIPDFDPNITPILPTDNNPYGLYLNASTGYKVEDNIFNSSTANKSTKYGVIINGSGTANNRIYRNTFTNLYAGSSAQGNNKGTGTGLVFKCNEYSNCSNDIKIIPFNKYDGIASNQGSISEPLANLFSHAGLPLSDINNDGVSINYYHNSSTLPIPRWIPKNYSTTVYLYNTGIAYNKATQCPVTGSGGGSTAKNLANSYEIIQSLSSEIAVIENQLNSLIDGGNTSMLLNEVTYSPTWDALDLRNNLLNKSPFLSDTVLASTVENESAMPPLMLTQVLSANPHASKSENVKEKIENRQNAIPDYLMNEIENSGKYASAKEFLESKALMLRNKRAAEIYSLIIEYKQDNINKSTVDSICSLLNFESTSITLFDQYTIMLQANRINEANNYRTLINAQNDVDLSYLATLVYDFYMNVKNADSLSVSDINQLTLIANNEGSSCNNIACNILLKTNKISYTEPICDINQTEAKSINKIQNADKKENLQFRIYPNPAKYWVIVYYKTGTSPSTIEISDLLGKVLYTKVIDQTEGELLIETNSFPSGTYFVKLQTKGATLKTEKLTISNK